MLMQIRWLVGLLLVGGCATTPSFRQLTILDCPECFDSCFQVARGKGADYLTSREYCQPHRMTMEVFATTHDQPEAPACCHTSPWGKDCVLCR